MAALQLAYGRGTIEVALPDGLSFDRLEAIPTPAISLREAFEEAWTHPFGIGDPAEPLQRGERIVLVVTDHTRPTPTRDLLELLWEKIRGRVAAEDVLLLVATGTHRPPTDQELEAMLGPYRHAFRTQIHDCDGDLVDVGASSRGTRILLNRSVAEADRVITIGHIGMHYYAGYSGGRKNILPGVAGRATIAANHAQLADPCSRACLYGGNPISDEMVEAAKLVPVAFILDVVLDSDGKVAKVVIGEPEAAHAAGRAFWDKHFQVPFNEPYDVVIASAGGHPKDINLYQAYKALYNAMRTVRDGGFVFLAAACPEGIGHRVFADWVQRSPTPEDVLALYEREGFALGGHKAVYLARDAKRASIYLRSEIDPETVRRYYMQPASDPASVLDAARETFGRAPRVLLLPHAEDTFPVRVE
jgi:nickel-dependent lactate racemase